MSTVEVCRYTGATYRQLDYWWRCGYIDGAERVVGSGQRRQWTSAQVSRVEALVRAAGIRNLPLDELADLLAGS